GSTQIRRDIDYDFAGAGRMTNNPIHLSFRFADVPMEKIGPSLLCRPRKPNPLRLLIVLLLLFAVGFGTSMAVSKLFPPETSVIGRSFYPALISAALAFLCLTTTTRRLQKCIYAGMQVSPFRSGVTELLLDNRGMHTTHPCLTQSVAWSVIIDVAEYSGFTLLKPSPYEYYPIPHASLPPGLTPNALQTQIAAWRAAAA
ncbi:MAG: hypothetical protein WCC57_04520, partial [Paracoccaceae bacterium]